MRCCLRVNPLRALSEPFLAIRLMISPSPFLRRCTKLVGTASHLACSLWDRTDSVRVRWHGNLRLFYFYKGLISYEVLPSDESDDHHYFAVGDKIRSGVTEIDYEDVKPTWLPFVGVENLREVVLEAIDSGGTLLIHTDTAAIILDPGGAAIGLQLLPSGGGQ